MAVWLLTVLCIWSIGLLRYPLDPDYTSGELLDHVNAWQSGEALYPIVGTAPGESLRVLNYPPFLFAAVRGLASITSDPLAAGRLLNGVAVVLLLLVLGACLRARGHTLPAVAGGVGLLGASLPFVYSAGQFHIEGWAVLGTVSGVALLDRSGPSDGRRATGAPHSAVTAVCAGLLLGAACLVKQTQVVPAVVVLAWSVAYFPRWRATVIGFGVAGVVGCAAITWGWGVEAWRHLVTYTVGTYSVENLLRQFGSFVLPWALLLAMAWRKGWAGGPTLRRDVFWWYWCGALVWTLSAGRDGASFGYFLDLHVATAVWVGPSLFGGAVDGAAPAVPWAPRWLRTTQVIGATLLVAVAVGANLGRLEARRTLLPRVCAALPATGPVLVEEAGVAAACGRRAALHPFIMTSLARRGLWDSSEVETAVARGDFGVAVLANDPAAESAAARDRWTAPLRRAFIGGEVTALGADWWIVRW